MLRLVASTMAHLALLLICALHAVFSQEASKNMLSKITSQTLLIQMQVSSLLHSL